MPKDYYPDMDSEMPMGADTGRDTQSKDTEEPEGETVMIPKSILQGKDFKVGDEVVLKLTHEYEEDFAAQYATEEPKETSELPGREEFDEADKASAY